MDEDRVRIFVSGATSVIAIERCVKRGTQTRNMLNPTIAEHGGRVFKTTGDGLPAVFPSVVEAVRCAVRIQEESFLQLGSRARTSSRPAHLTAVRRRR